MASSMILQYYFYKSYHKITRNGGGTMIRSKDRISHEGRRGNMAPRVQASKANKASRDQSKQRKGPARGPTRARDKNRANHSTHAQDRQPRAEQTKDPYGARRSSLDLSLKEAILGKFFSS